MTTLTFRRSVTALVLGLAVLANSQQAPAQAIPSSGMVEVTPLPSINTNAFIPQVLRSSAIATPVKQTSDATVNPLVRALSGDPFERDTLRWPSLQQQPFAVFNPELAVGPNQVLVPAGGRIAIHSRTGTLLFERSAEEFFDARNAIGTTNCAYDAGTGRFYVIGVERSQFDWFQRRFIVAVSDDSDPRGVWHRSSLDATIVEDSVTYHLNSLSLGFNKDALVISGTMHVSVPAEGSAFFYIPKAPLLSGSPVSATLFRDPELRGYGLSQVSDPGVKSVHGASRYDNTHLRVCTFSNSGGTPVMNAWLVSIPEYDDPNLFMPGISGTIELWPHDLGSVAYRSGKLLAAHTVSPNGQTNNAIRWYEFDVAGVPAAAPTLVQSGDVLPPTTSDFYFTPAIEKNAVGEVSVMFTRSNSTIAPETWVAARAKADPPGTMRAPFRVAASDGGYRSRWTSTIKVVVDPVDNRSFWGISLLSAFDLYEGAMRTEVSKWLLAPTLASIQVPPTISAGETTTGTVILSNPTYKDTVVSLSSGAAFLAVPDKVRVPAGSESATFTLRAGTPASTQEVTVTATLSAASVSAKTKVFGARAEFNLSRTAVEGGSGQMTTLTVRLPKPAPAGGTIVTLGSSSGLVTLPPTMTVPAGQSAASIDFAATATNTNVDVTISGTWAGTTRTRVLTVTPPEVAQFLVTPYIVGGSTNKITAIVTLANNAGPGGQVVKLTSSSSLITVPTTITIPAGSKSRELELDHVSTPTKTTVTVTAVSGVTPVARAIVVAPPIVVKLSPSDGKIAGGVGHSLIYTVGIGSIAPAGGTTVYLSLSNSLAVLSSSAVVIPAGSRSTTVTVTAPTRVSTPQITVLAATTNGSYESVWIEVRPVDLASLAVAPAEVVGGSATAATATVTLNGPAPAGGTTVNLSSSDTSAASVPATVTIPEGQTGATVAVSHFKVSSNRKVTITGTLNGISKTAKIVVQR